MSIAATMPMPGLRFRAGLGAALAALALGSTGAAIASRPVAHQTTAPVVTAPVTTSSTGSTSTATTSGAPTTNGAPSTAFGQQVKQQVATCKAAAAAANTHGIGACVSAWVVANNPGHTHHGSASGGAGTSGTGTGG